MREAGGERRGLAEVAAEADHAQARIAPPAAAPGSSKLSSVLPSSTTMISYGRPHAVERRRSARGRARSRYGASLRIGMTTESSGSSAVQSVTAIISALPSAEVKASAAAGSCRQTRPPTRRATHDAGQPARPAVPLSSMNVDRLVAVPDRQQPIAEVADAAADGDGERELPDRRCRATPGEQDEDLERRRRRQQRRHQHRHHAVALADAPCARSTSAPLNRVRTSASPPLRPT